MYGKTINNFPNMKKKKKSISFFFEGKKKSISWYHLYTKPIKSITYKVIKYITCTEIL